MATYSDKVGLLAERMLNEIMKSGLGPGDMMVTEASLFAKYHGSQLTLSESLQVVETKGALVQRRGTYVRINSIWSNWFTGTKFSTHSSLTQVRTKYWRHCGGLMLAAVRPQSRHISYRREHALRCCHGPASHPRLSRAQGRECSRGDVRLHQLIKNNGDSKIRLSAQAVN